MEVDGLDRDQRLVVVHAQRRIVGAARLGMEHRIGRQRAARIDPGLAQFGDSRLDYLDLLTAEAAGLARVRIEPGDRKDRRSETEIPAQRPLRNASSVDDGRRGQAFDRPAQGEMDGHGNNPQPRAYQHHYRNLVSRRELGEVLGVARMMKAGAIEALLVNRVGHQRGGATAANIAHGDLDRAKDRRRVGSVWAAGHSMNGCADWCDRKRVWENGRCARRSVDRTNRHLPVETPGQ